MLAFILLYFQLAALGLETVEAIEELLGIEIIGTGRNYDELTLEEKTAILKECTKTVANLKLDLSCYPMGYTTTLLFDLDGNPIP